KCFVRGRRLGEMGLQDISNEIGTSPFPHLDFRDVEIDWNDLLKLGRDLVPSVYEYWVSAAEDAEVGPYRTLKSDYARKAVGLHTEQMRTDPTIKPDDALTICRTSLPKLRELGFLSRIWPQARGVAGLEPTAPPGPKPKKNRRPKQNRRA